MKAIYFHIGMPKTGTSALQRVLSTIKSNKIDYSVFGRMSNIAHHELFSILLQSDESSLLHSLELLVLAAKDSLSSRIVFSSESLLPLITNQNRLELIHAFLRDAGYHAHFFVAVREISSFFEAMFLQQTRFGRSPSLDFEHYLDTRIAWAHNLLLNLCRHSNSESHTRLLDICFFKKGLNIIDCFFAYIGANELLEKPNDYDRISKSTSRYTHYVECLLANIDTFNFEYASSFTRNQIIKLTAHHGIAGDTRNYTLYTQETFLKIQTEIRDFCKQIGYYDYLTAFQDVGAENDAIKKTVDLSYSNLDCCKDNFYQLLDSRLIADISDRL